MSQDRTHKRKRSLQDTKVDLSKMRMALHRLEALKEELDGIEETEEEMQSITEHVGALEEILRGAKKPKVTFSTVVLDDLKKAGLTRKRLVFSAQKVTELANGLPRDVENLLADLYSRIKKIYTYVNMDYEPGSRMILDAILLALAEVASGEQREVAILPEMRIAQGDGVQITHPNSGFELWLSGNVDYAVIEYDNVEDNKGRLIHHGPSIFSLIPS